MQSQLDELLSKAVAVRQALLELDPVAGLCTELAKQNGRKYLDTINGLELTIGRAENAFASISRDRPVMK